MEPLLLRWRDVVASAAGPPSTTRLVLLTLSLHMNKGGGDAFPSTRLLAERTGLSERAVCTHLEHAEAGGWIVRERVGSGQAWKRMTYRPLIPKALNEVQQLEGEGTEGGSAPLPPEGTERRSEGAEPHDRKALNDVQSNPSGNPSSNPTDAPSVDATAKPPRSRKRRSSRKRSPNPSKPDPLAAPAQQLVRHLDAELKAAGAPGVGSRWAAAVRIAKSALRDIELAQLEEAVTWGMRSDYWRPRLVSEGAKLIRAVFAEHREPNRRNGAPRGRSAYRDRAGEGPQHTEGSPWAGSGDDYSHVSE